MDQKLRLVFWPFRYRSKQCVFVLRRHTLVLIKNSQKVAWLQLSRLKPNKLQEVGVCSLINLRPIISSSDFLWLALRKPKMMYFWISRSFFYVKNQPNRSNIFLMENLELHRRKTFMNDPFIVDRVIFHGIYKGRNSEDVIWFRGRNLEDVIYMS